MRAKQPTTLFSSKYFFRLLSISTLLFAQEANKRQAHIADIADLNIREILRKNSEMLMVYSLWSQTSNFKPQTRPSVPRPSVPRPSSHFPIKTKSRF
jgi:hypothetical protein